VIGSKFPCTTPVRHEFTRSPPSPSCTGQEIGSGHADLWYRHGSSRPATSAIPPRVEVDDWLLVQLVGADVKLTQRGVKLESATTLLDGLNGVIWHRYGCQIQQVLRRDRVTRTAKIPVNIDDGDVPF